MWSGVRIVALAVVCLAVSTPIKACSRQLTDRTMYLGACFLGVQKLAKEIGEFVNIPDISINGNAFRVTDIHLDQLKVNIFGGCRVGSVGIPPPPTTAPEALLPMDIGSGEQPPTPLKPTIPPVRRNRRYTVTYSQVKIHATAVWRRRRDRWYQGSVGGIATGNVKIQLDAGIDRANCPVFNNARCTASVDPIPLTIGNRRYLGNFYERQLRAKLTEQIRQEVKKGCQAAAAFLQDADDNPEVKQIFRG